MSQHTRFHSEAGAWKRLLARRRRHSLGTRPRRAGFTGPRRPQASPLYRLIEDHFDEFCTVYDERFPRRWGYWRKVVGDCRVAFAHFLYDRKLLGELSRVVARTVTSFVRATVGEKDLSVGIVSSIQTRGSLANWHPHLHLLVTDGGFRPEGTFVRLPLQNVATLTEVFRRAVLRMFVKRELMDIDTAQGMLSWPHSGFHARDGVWAAAEDKEFTVRLARYCARNPIALARMEYDAEHGAVTYHSDKPTGPTAGGETTDVLEFLARLTSHILNKGQVLSAIMAGTFLARGASVARLSTARRVTRSTRSSR